MRQDDKGLTTLRLSIVLGFMLGAAAPDGAYADVLVIGSEVVTEAINGPFVDARSGTLEDAAALGFGDAHVLVIAKLIPHAADARFMERLETFLQTGRGVVLMWDAAGLVLSGISADYRWDNPPPPQLGWFAGNVGAGTNLVFPSFLSAVDSHHVIWPEFVGQQIAWGDVPQYFVTVTDFDPQLQIIASYAGDGTPAFPLGSYPALLVGRACAATVVLLPMNVNDAINANVDLSAIVRRSATWVGIPRPLPGPCPPNPDMDNDGVPSREDNCPDDINPGQEDGDGDGVGDVCDPCPADPADDQDIDSYCADEDNCPETQNPEQEDFDDDGIGDACDRCFAIPGDDADLDELCPGEDNCPHDFNADQADRDEDGIGDVCDDDADGDGLADAIELELGMSPADQDSDDDGLLDGLEARPGEDEDSDGLINGLDPDADEDGLPDGLEVGVETPSDDTDLRAGVFIRDADPSSTTDPLNSDSDGGGALDGVEDRLTNGRIDPGEGDPTDPTDDHRFLPDEVGDAGTDDPPSDAAMEDTGDAGANPTNEPDVGTAEVVDAGPAAAPVDTGASPPSDGGARNGEIPDRFRVDEPPDTAENSGCQCKFTSLSGTLWALVGRR